MNYPFWDVPPIGGGMVIAFIATVHVLVAHFAVGAGLYVAFTEWRLKGQPNDLLKGFLKRYGKFLILFSFVFGAITGVGIWFAIGLASPRATSALIHNYMWGWAAEWCLFFIEIAAGYCYYKGFDRLPAARRRILAYIYAGAAWGSLVIINGILTFMLTPGEWIATGAFWDGFFNPTYWPSLVLRTISSLSFAAIFVAIVANGSRAYDREEARRIINHAAWFLAPLVLMVPVSGWYFAMVPADALRMVMGGAIAMHLFFMFGVAASTLIGFYAYVGLIRHKRYVNMETAVLLAAIAFIATGSMEFVREGVRKPWIIYDTMYSNGYKPEEAAMINREGILTHQPWVVPPGVELASLDSVEVGEFVYTAQCSQCHNMGGPNDLTHLIYTWDADLLAKNLENIHRLKMFMPPLVGTPAERSALFDYLLSIIEEEAVVAKDATPALNNETLAMEVAR